MVKGDNDEHIECVKERYAEIFKPELGTVKGVTAKLHLKDNVKPVFQKARPVPYALRTTVEKELKRMEDEGIFEPMEVSNWATPIVCVPKTDGSVRICGDYKGTVNPAIQTEQFPISYSYSRFHRWLPCVYNDRQLFLEPSITALNLCHPSKTQ